MNTYSLDAEVDMTSKKAKSKKEQPVSVLTKPVDNAKVTWVFKGLTKDQEPSLDIPSNVLHSGPTRKRIDKSPGVFDHWEVEAVIKFPPLPPSPPPPPRVHTAKYDFYVTGELLSFEAAFTDPGPYLVIDRNGDPPETEPPPLGRLKASVPLGASGTPGHP